jgi:hypothetical protein
MMLSINLPDIERNDRPSALTTPAVTVHWKPYGLPIAIATWPTRSRLEIAEFRWNEARSPDADHRQIAVRIDAYHSAGRAPAVEQRHAYSRRARHDVAVGQ